MKETTKRLLTVGGAVVTVLALALSLLSFAVISAGATGSMPPAGGIIPGESGTSSLTLPEGGNVDTNDALTPDDSTLAPAVTSAPGSSARPDSTSSPVSDTSIVEDDGNGVLGAIIAVVVVVAIILVVIALIPRKKR
jgi:hypothetical protein